MRGKGTALITGASSGIGEAFARELASQGYDLIIVARRGGKLRELAVAIGQASARRVEVVEADLSSQKEIERLASSIEERNDLTLLVNNAGFGTTGPFVQVQPDKQRAMIRVHVDASVRLTRAALPQMIAARRGGVILLSSISAFLPSPSRSLYGATKLLLNKFGDGLAMELEGTGIHVQVLCPGFTYSGFHDTDEFEGWSRSQVSRSLWMSSEELVDISLQRLGRETILVPGWRNKLLVRLGSNPLTRPILYAQQKRRFSRG